MRSLYKVWLLLIITVVNSLADTNKYFPTGVLEYTAENDLFVREWYSEHLHALEELSLYSQKEKLLNLEVYRFLWLRTFNDPIVVRIVLTEYSGEIIVKQCDGAGGYSPGHLIVNRSFNISMKEKKQFSKLLRTKEFWSLPSKIEDGGFDGAQWIIEGVKKGKYHIVDRWSPESGPLRELGLLFLKLGQVKNEKIY